MSLLWIILNVQYKTNHVVRLFGVLDKSMVTKRINGVRESMGSESIDRKLLNLKE